MAAQRISSGSRAHVVPGDKQQVRDRRRSIGTLALLRNTHCPEDADALGVGDHVRDFLQGIYRQSAALGRELQREGL